MRNRVSKEKLHNLKNNQTIQIIPRKFEWENARQRVDTSFMPNCKEKQSPGGSGTINRYYWPKFSQSPSSSSFSASFILLDFLNWQWGSSLPPRSAWCSLGDRRLLSVSVESSRYELEAKLLEALGKDFLYLSAKRFCRKLSNCEIITFWDTTPTKSKVVKGSTF